MATAICPECDAEVEVDNVAAEICSAHRRTVTTPCQGAWELSRQHWNQLAQSYGDP